MGWGAGWSAQGTDSLHRPCRARLAIQSRASHTCSPLDTGARRSRVLALCGAERSAAQRANVAPKPTPRALTPDPTEPLSPAYFLKRLALIGYTLAVVSLLVFGITQILPADAATMLLGENATPAALAAIRDRLGLNDPAWVQYWRWLSGVLHGDFGTSMRTGQPVGPAMLEALGRSLQLAFAAILLTLAIALPLGILGALRRGK